MACYQIHHPNVHSNTKSKWRNESRDEEKKRKRILKAHRKAIKIKVAEIKSKDVVDSVEWFSTLLMVYRILVQHKKFLFDVTDETCVQIGESRCMSAYSNYLLRAATFHS